MILLIILLVISIGLAFLLAWICDTLSRRWVTAGIIPLLCLVAFLSWQGVEELKGRPTSNMPTKEFEIMAIIQEPPYFIFYLIRPLDDSEPLLIVRKWTSAEGKKAGEIDKQLRQGKSKNGKIARHNGNNGEDDNGTFEDYDLKENQQRPKQE